MLCLQRVVVFLSAFVVLNYTQTALSVESKARQKSSEIPEVRQFPLSSKVNACTDFHKYVCQEVEESFQLRDDRSSHTFAFDDSDERLLEKKKTFFKNIQNEKKLSARAVPMKNFYLACMNEKSAADEERKLTEKLKAEVNQMKTIDDFVKVNRRNMTNEKWSVMGYDIIPNTSNPLVYDITFDVYLMGLPEHSYYDNDELVKAYAELMAEFFNTLYPNGNKADHLKRAQAMIEFEKRFKNSYPFPAEFRQRYTQPRLIGVDDYVKKISKMGLKEFFVKVPKKTLLRDFIPESVDFLQAELKPENLQILKDMYLYRNARSFMDDAYPDLFKKRMEFRHKFLGGPLTRPERQERCTDATTAAYSKELDFEILPRVFPNFPRDKMEAVAEKIRQSIISGIEQNTWLSAKSKEGAINKIRRAKLQLVQPRTAQEWDFKEIVKLDPTKPYENSRRLAEAGHREQFRRLREGVNQLAWGMSPLVVNAYYSPDKNKFVLPIGILQYPFFMKDGDLIENLGAVGAVVGHELGHSIDDEGSKFDAEGKLNQWMAEEDLKKFRERGLKMIQQFNKIGHNGDLTQGENIADLVGLTFAYNAAFPKGVGKIEDKKRFFVSYARLWCGVAREKAKEMQLKTDPHSLGFARINEQVKHQKGFQEAYSCKQGDAMFLPDSERVQIW